MVELPKAHSLDVTRMERRVSVEKVTVHVMVIGSVP